MKRIGLSTFISFCLLLFVSMTTFAKKEDLKLQLFRGQHYTHVITQESTIKENPQDAPMLNQKIGLRIRQDVVDQLGNGNCVIEASIERFNLELKFNDKVSRYDSDTINVLNKYYKSLNFLTQVKLTYELSPQGVVSKLRGFEVIKKKMESDTELSGLLRSFGTEQFILEFYNYIPREMVGVGDKWTGNGILPDLMNLKYDIQYTFKEESAQRMTLSKKAAFTYLHDITMADSSLGQMKQTGTQKGTLVIDTKTRMCLSAEMDQQLDIFVPGKDKPVDKNTVPIKITTITKMQLVKK